MRERDSHFSLMVLIPPEFGPFRLKDLWDQERERTAWNLFWPAFQIKLKTLPGVKELRPYTWRIYSETNPKSLSEIQRLAARLNVPGHVTVFIAWRKRFCKAPVAKRS